jgi:succinate dehydrogenase / fumarate reductase cytochrome b subunit
MATSRHHFLLRRIHSLMGLLPVGGFVVLHLLENARAALGAEAFDRMQASKDASAWMPFYDWAFVFIPIAYHACYGIFIASQSRHTLSLGIYNQSGTWRFWMQRVSGILLLAFLAFHVWETRIHSQGLPTYAWMSELFTARPWVRPLYVLGILAAAYHFANGLWSASIVWGLAVREASQRAVLRFVSVPVFLLVAGLGCYALFQFRPAPRAAAAGPAPQAAVSGPPMELAR